MDGAPDRSRTYDPQYRKLMLYPAELRVHSFGDVVCRKKRQTMLYMMPLTGMEVNFNLKRGVVKIVIFTTQEERKNS